MTNSNNQEEDERWTELLARLKQLAKDKGITNDMIAEATGFKQGNVNRILNAKYSPRLANLFAIAEAIGVDIVIEERE